MVYTSARTGLVTLPHFSIMTGLISLGGHSVLQEDPHNRIYQENIALIALQGVSALTSVTDPCYLAVPSQSNVGCIRVCNAAEGNHILAELGAHKSGLVSNVTLMHLFQAS